MAIHLGRSSPNASRDRPERRRGRPARQHEVALPAAPTWSCSRWGLPCRRRCRQRGALLPHLFTLTPLRLAASRSGSFSVALSLKSSRLRGKDPAGRYPAPYVDGARTFLPRGLSTIARAAVRPTDVIRMGAHARRVKGPRWLIGSGPRLF